jgi:hypothetical protein
MNKLNRVRIKIGDYFKFKGADGTDNINEFNKQDGETYIDTPTGLAPILALIKKEKNDILEIKTEDGLTSRVAEKHIYPQKDGSNVWAKDATHLMTRNGERKIVNKKFFCNDYVYDISIPDPHVYYSSNGILHHNSLFGAVVGANAAFKGKNVLIITLEMSEEEYFKRIDANLLDLNIANFKNIDSNIFREKHSILKDKIGKIKVIEYGAGMLSASMLDGKLDKLRDKEDFDPDFIIVDYLALMKSDLVHNMNNSNTYFTSVATELRSVAQRRNKPILSFAQLDRSSIGETEVSEKNASLAKGIFDASDTYAFLTKNTQLAEQNRLLGFFTKNRPSGKTNFKFLLDVDYSKMRMTSIEATDQYSRDETNELNDLMTQTENTTFGSEPSMEEFSLDNIKY